jgi:hypothetical protein
MTFTGRSGQVSAAAAVPVAAPARLAASKQDAKARWFFMMVSPGEPAWSPRLGIAPDRDYDSAGAAFLGIRAVFAGNAGFLPVHKAAKCPIYDLFLVAN